MYFQRRKIRLFVHFKIQIKKSNKFPAVYHRQIATYLLVVYSEEEE